MEARETDKLFRDKLKHLASTPKTDSWERLESMLDKKAEKAGFMYWRVAAIGLLLIASALIVIFWNQNPEPAKQELAQTKKESSESTQSDHSIVPEISEHVVQEEETVKKQPTVDEQTIQHQSAKKKIKEHQPLAPEKQPVRDQKLEPDTQKQEVVPIEINMEDQQLAVEESPREIDQPEPVKKKKRLPIKITYKRGNSPVPGEDEMIARQKLDSTGGKRIKGFFAQTRDINPGDFWADIREAKHNLFQRKENSKKDNVKNLNK